MQSWDLTKIEAPEGTRSPAVLETVDGARAIVIRLAPGQELGDHQVRERARRFTGSNFDRFEIHELERDGGRVAAIIVHEVERAPLIFTHAAGTTLTRRADRSRHSRLELSIRATARRPNRPRPKTCEPSSSDDSITFRDEWLGNISEVTAAPPGSQIAVVTAIEEDNQGRPSSRRMTRRSPTAPESRSDASSSSDRARQRDERGAPGWGYRQ